jgi:ferredoxin
MKRGLFKREYTRTAYIQLDTSKCKACWKCIEACNNNVIGKIDIFFHKHVKFIEGNNCTGCHKCIDICVNGALLKANKNEKELTGHKLLVNKAFWINNFLLLSGLIMIVSGLTLQFGYHIGNHEGHSNKAVITNVEGIQTSVQIRGIDINKTVLGFDYYDWTVIHKTAIVVFSLVMFYHIYRHWKWYRTVISRHLMTKNIQVISLSILFVMVALTGFIPWLIYLSDKNSLLRIIFIEVHDKLALLLAVYLVLHVVKRRKHLFSL